MVEEAVHLEDVAGPHLAVPADPLFQGSVDKNVEAVWLVFQHIVGAAADDYAGALIGYLFNDVGLGDKDLVRHRQALGVKIQVRQKAAGAFLLVFPHKFLREAGFFGGHGDQLFIVKRYAQILGYPAAD